MTKEIFLQVLASDTVQMLAAFALFLIIGARLVTIWKHRKVSDTARDTASRELPPLPQMDIHEPLPNEYSSARGLGAFASSAPSLPEIPLSPEQRQRAAEWLRQNPL